ncbi:hypothetical protein SY88_11080 [Clostridiales bacterium PH28_bin88]|nr:hypothetical protein SY88_11080 [Clostridiales bacterium PH28_bin88]
MPKQHFLRGAMVLTLAGLTSKVIGALYRIPLARLMGGEGMGLYQMAYPVYTMLLALSTAGIPVAISILVAEHEARGDAAGARRVFRVALGMLAVTGALSSFLLFRGAFFLAQEVLHEPRSFYPVVALSPAVFLVAVMSAFRGYFQGQQVMAPTAVSQVVEQVVRVSAVLAGAFLLLPYGEEFAAAGATFGAVAGSAAGLVLLLFLYAREQWGLRGGNRQRARRRVHTEPTGKLMWRIAVIALPLSLGGLVMPVMQMIDAAMVPIRLQAAGFSPDKALDLFGQLTGFAGTLINLPTIITVSLAVSLVPAVAEARAGQDLEAMHHCIGEALRMTFMLVLPAAAGLWLLAAPISLLLYDLPEVGIPLRVLAPGVLLVGLYQTTSGALQGLGKTYLPVRHLLAGAMVKVLMNYYLTAMPALAVKGAAAATVGGFLVAFVLNYISVVRFARFRLRVADSLLKPAIAATIMTLAVDQVYGYSAAVIGFKAGTVAAVLAGAGVYLVGLLVLGAVRELEIAMLPLVGPPLAGYLRKLGVVRR